MQESNKHNHITKYTRPVTLFIWIKVNKLLYVIIALMMLCISISCNNNHNNSSIYDVKDGGEQGISLLYWHLYGPLDIINDSVTINKVISNPFENTFITKGTTSTTSFINLTYSPKFGQLDFKEVFGINADDTICRYSDKCMLMKCTLESDKDTTLYLEVKTSMPTKFWINGDSIQRTEIQGLNIYKTGIRAGKNVIIAKTDMNVIDLSFEATLYSKNLITRLYTEHQSSNIIYPLISRKKKTITLTNNHQKLGEDSIKLSFYDTYGKLVDAINLNDDSMTYVVPRLEPNKSFICKMQIGRHIVSQHVCCGNGDDSYTQFSQMANELPKNHPKTDEINEILSRMKFLLEHPSRHQGDWWWQFKIAPLTYQLEYIFTHLNSRYGIDSHEPIIKFMTYYSQLDGGTQRYILVTPENITPNKSYPLVIVIRPHIENHRHFFTSPQIARQWAVNQMQTMAKRYGYIIMMPEMRTYLSEELTPMAEEELKLAIKDVKEQYLIDENRIYLHANCSGGYRALRLATQNPNMFAAIGLYAPVYNIESDNQWSKEVAPQELIGNIKETPILIHYDPIDQHSPYMMFKDLIKDCKKHDIPIKISVKRNSGIYYNVVLTGDEAFEFFKDKKRTEKKELKNFKKENHVIADLYSKPFVYIYNSNDKSIQYKELIDSIRTEYESYHFSKLPLLPDTLVDSNHIQSKNIMLIGNTYTNNAVNKLLKVLNYNSPKLVDGYGRINLSVYNNPYNKERIIVIYDADPSFCYTHIFNKAWTITLQDTSDILHLRDWPEIKR